MSLFDSFKKRSTLDAAIKQVSLARKSEGGKAEQLYKGAYHGFAKVVVDNPVISEALYHWGFALLHEAATQPTDQAIETLEDAISKFSFCLLTSPNYLGAAVDGGVTFMELARISPSQSHEYLYQMAQQFFEKAEAIQKGSASYNLACIHALSGDHAACKNALELAKGHGTLPSEQAMLQDADLSNIHELTWFKEFLEALKIQPEQKSTVEEEIITYEPSFNLKKTEDFDYYNSQPELTKE